MKRLAIIVFAFFLSVSATAQKNRFQPLETWPYVYENFNPGTILTHKGASIDYQLLNINLVDGKVHYIDNGIIMQADMNTISKVRIGQDIYINHGGFTYKIFAETAHCDVILKTEIDYDSLSKVNIGYGKSAVASASNISAYTLPGGNNINKSLEDITKNRYTGNELPLLERYYLMIDGMMVRAAKKDILDIAGNKKDEVKQYLKANKVKWKDVYSLSLLGEYLYGLNINL